MLSTVLATIADHGLCAPGDRIVVAVSGGPDSMALLAVLWEARERLGVTLEVAGVDHGLRAAAAGELDLVAARAAALDLPFTRLAVDVAASRRGASLQDAARRARLGGLAALADRRGAQRVALGHQADDQAETVLFRILRGTGLAGLRGIPYRRGPFIRPLLDVRRAEILRYLRRRSIPFIEDPSNADLRFARARLRHRILPLLAEENPRVVEALRALAMAAIELGNPGRGPEPSRDGLRPAEPGSVHASGVLEDPPLELPRRVAATVERLRRRGGTATVDLAGGRRVEISYGSARVAARPRAQLGGRGPAPLTIAAPGNYCWSAGQLVVHVDVRDSGRKLADDLGAGAKDTTRRGRHRPSEFDGDHLAWPLIVRTRQPGDRMRPRGSRGSRKLSDLMIDAKIARGARASLPVVTDARGQLLLVPGLRPAEVARPTALTRRFVDLGFEPAEG